MEIRIKKASVEDARIISFIGVASWQSAYRGIIPDSYLDSLSVEQQKTHLVKSIENQNCEFAIAEVEGESIGMICFHPSSHGNAIEGGWEVEALYLLPNQWKRGIGSALMQYAFQFMCKKNIITCDAWVLTENHRARKFYEHMEMSLTGDKETLTIGDTELIEVCYRIYFK